MQAFFAIFFHNLILFENNLKIWYTKEVKYLEFGEIT